jgi:hypothetical protein
LEVESSTVEGDPSDLLDQDRQFERLTAERIRRSRKMFSDGLDMNKIVSSAEARNAAIAKTAAPHLAQLQTRQGQELEMMKAGLRMMGGTE